MVIKCIYTLELCHVAVGGVVPGREADEEGASGPVDAAHADLVLRELPPDLLLRHEAVGRHLPPPLEELEEHGGGLVDVVVARAQEPPQRQVVQLLRACVSAWNGRDELQLVSERNHQWKVPRKGNAVGVRFLPSKV
jgi:hypothetical protein